MSVTVTLEEAKSRLGELIEKLAPGEEILIVREKELVAKLVSGKPARKPRQPGSGKGMLTIVSEDDEHLEDFKEYMQWSCSWTRTRSCGSSSPT
jgi:antitoxin (DNA-binding transcriptional repressor) of toxin-antitoxin stability system